MAHTSRTWRPPREHRDSGGQQAAPALAGGEQFRFTPSALPPRVPHLLQKRPQGHRPPQAGGLPFRVQDAGPGCRQVRATGAGRGLTVGSLLVGPLETLTGAVGGSCSRMDRNTGSPPQSSEGHRAQTVMVGGGGWSLTRTPWAPPTLRTHRVSIWIPSPGGVLEAVQGGRGNRELGGLRSLKAGHPQTAEAARGHEGTGEAALKPTAGPPRTSPQWFQQPGVATRA